MSKYLIEVKYNSEGTKGLMKEGGVARRNFIDKLLTESGGSLDEFYFSFGEKDAVLIVDFPDTVTAAAVSLAVNASGSIALTTTPLLTPEELDNASKKKIGYRAPGK